MIHDGIVPSHAFRIVPRGPFSWSASFSVLERFPPPRHTFEGNERDVRLSLLSDDDFTPVDVHLRFAGGALHGLVSDVAKTSATRRARKRSARSRIVSGPIECGRAFCCASPTREDHSVGLMRPNLRPNQ